MPLYRKRALRRPGAPEFVAAAAVLASVAAVVAWLQAATAPALERTLGSIASCDVRLTHYNATDNLPKVFLDYTYTAGIATYAGHWEGFWPATDSPDSLPPEQLDRLKKIGRAITVFYDPADPRRSFLHTPERKFSLPYALAAAIAALASLFYVVRVYPRWKSRT